MGELVHNRHTARGVGLAASTSRDAVLTTASAVEREGFASFWLNNPPGANALALLGEVASIAPTLQLGVGVIPFSSRSPAQVAFAVAEAGVPRERLYLGVGSGSGTGGLQRVIDGVKALREEFDGHIVVAALGPKMCRFAGEAADGVLFNWLTPEYAVKSSEWVLEGAQAAGRSAPRMMAYVRTALGEKAIERLGKEASTYASIPSYAAHFRRMGTTAFDTGIAAHSPGDIGRALAAWDGVVDDVVARVITESERADQILQVVEAARPAR